MKWRIEHKPNEYGYSWCAYEIGWFGIKKGDMLFAHKEDELLRMVKAKKPQKEPYEIEV